MRNWPQSAAVVGESSSHVLRVADHGRHSPGPAAYQVVVPCEIQERGADGSRETQAAEERPLTAAARRPVHHRVVEVVDQSATAAEFQAAKVGEAVLRLRELEGVDFLAAHGVGEIRIGASGTAAVSSTGIRSSFGGTTSLVEVKPAGLPSTTT